MFESIGPMLRRRERLGFGTGPHGLVPHICGPQPLGPHAQINGRLNGFSASLNKRPVPFFPSQLSYTLQGIQGTASWPPVHLSKIVFDTKEGIPIEFWAKYPGYALCPRCSGLTGNKTPLAKEYPIANGHI